MRIMILTFARIKYSYNNYQKVIIFAMRKKTKVLDFYDELIQEALDKIKMMY